MLTPGVSLADRSAGTAQPLGGRSSQGLVPALDWRDTPPLRRAPRTPSVADDRAEVADARHLLSSSPV